MQKPIQIVELLKTVAQAFLVWLVVMGYWPLTEVQQAVTLALVVAVINLVGAYFETRGTTPLADPRAADGEPLVRVENPTRSPMEKLKTNERINYRGNVT